MAWQRFWKRSDPGPEPQPATQTEPGAGTVGKRKLPAHLARHVERASPRPDPGIAPPEPVQRRLAAMKRQRLAMLYDIEQGELALANDNPWQHRIELLTQAMGTVADDLKALKQIRPSPYFPVPPTLIVVTHVSTEPAASVRFTIEPETFVYAEDPDWAERGHQVIRTELIRETGDPGRLIPGDVPAELREPLLSHLTDSLFVLASDLRDQVIDDEPLPESPTLADLARPCPRCGGWTDWHGTCQACAARAAGEMALKREEARLLDERASAAEEQHRLAERVPVARRRLHDLETQIAALSADQP